MSIKQKLKLKGAPKFSFRHTLYQFMKLYHFILIIIQEHPEEQPRYGSFHYKETS